MMWYKPYGKTGKDVSVIGCGGMRFANPQDVDANAEIVLHAHERGINYFDTAPGYCADKSEEIMAAAFGHMKREEFYVATKSASDDGDALRRQLETSLKRLGVEAIDFYHIWCVVTLDSWNQRVKGGAVAAAVKAKEEGLIRHLAVSSHLPGNELQTLLNEGPFEGVTLGYCAINFPYRRSALEAAERMGLGVVTMNPLGGGLIPNNAELFDFIRGPEDGSVVAAALRFNVSHPGITSALVGFTSCEHVEQACAAVEHFRPYSLEHVESIRRKILDSFNDLCNGCGYCMPCDEGINIPQLMDSYDQVTLSSDGDMVHAVNRLKWHWSLPPESAEACTLCGKCEQQCTQHLPIRDRLAAIADYAAKHRNKD